MGRNAEFDADHDYRMSHRPPDPEYGSSMDNHEMMFPGDLNLYRVYGHRKAAQETPDMFREEPHTIRTIESVRGNPDAPVTIHRAVPSHVTEIHPGDWVTPHPCLRRATSTGDGANPRVSGTARTHPVQAGPGRGSSHRGKQHPRVGLEPPNLIPRP